VFLHVLITNAYAHILFISYIYIDIQNDQYFFLLTKLIIYKEALEGHQSSYIQDNICIYEDKNYKNISTI